MNLNKTNAHVLADFARVVVLSPAANHGNRAMFQRGLTLISRITEFAGAETSEVKHREALNKALNDCGYNDLKFVICQIVEALYGPELNPENKFDSDTFGRIVKALERKKLIPV